jgi:hypothetical protein
MQNIQNTKYKYNLTSTTHFIATFTVNHITIAIIAIHTLNAIHNDQVMCATKLTQRTAFETGLVLVLVVVVLFLLVLQLRQTIFTHWRSLIWFSIYYSVAQFATFFANRAVSFSTILLILLIKTIAGSESAIPNEAFIASITVINFTTHNLSVGINVVAARANRAVSFSGIIVLLLLLLLLVILAIVAIRANPVLTVVVASTLIVFSAVDGDFATAFCF